MTKTCRRHAEAATCRYVQRCLPANSLCDLYYKVMLGIHSAQMSSVTWAKIWLFSSVFARWGTLYVWHLIENGQRCITDSSASFPLQKQQQQISQSPVSESQIEQQFIKRDIPTAWYTSTFCELQRQIGTACSANDYEFKSWLTRG